MQLSRDDWKKLATVVFLIGVIYDYGISLYTGITHREIFILGENNLWLREFIRVGNPLYLMYCVGCSLLIIAMLWVCRDDSVKLISTVVIIVGFLHIVSGSTWWKILL